MRARRRRNQNSKIKCYDQMIQLILFIYFGNLCNTCWNRSISYVSWSSCIPVSPLGEEGRGITHVKTHVWQWFLVDCNDPNIIVFDHYILSHLKLQLLDKSWATMGIQRRQRVSFMNDEVYNKKVSLHSVLQ